MKRISIILVVIAILFSACATSVFDDLPAPQYRHNSVSVYLVDEDYFVVLEDYTDHGVIKRWVKYTAERTCKEKENLKLIPNYDSERFVDMPFDEVTQMLGQPHCDYGSGQYIPSYATEDAYLLCMIVNNEIVTGVFKLDLVTGESGEYTWDIAQ